MSPLVRTNRMRKKLFEEQSVMGMEMWSRDPRMIDLLGQAGFDFALVENEHVAQDWTTVEVAFRAAEAAGLTPMYRCEQCIGDVPPSNEIIKAFKAGAQAVMVPQVESAESAQRVVEAVKYPPLGHRGVCIIDRGGLDPTSDATDPFQVDVASFAAAANEQTMIWVIIESPRAMENIDSILAVDGIDVVGFGPADYALTAGLTSGSGNKIAAVQDEIAQAAKRAGKHMWVTTFDGSTVPIQQQDGFRIFLMGSDLVHVDRMFRGLVADARN